MSFQSKRAKLHLTPEEIATLTSMSKSPGSVRRSVATMSISGTVP